MLQFVRVLVTSGKIEPLVTSPPGFPKEDMGKCGMN